MEQSKKSLWIGVAVLIGAIIVIGVAGIIALKPQPEMIMGEVEASEYRVSGKVPGRLDRIIVNEGSYVMEGDTLCIIDSPEIEAKKAQAEAAKAAAEAQNNKANKGARSQQIAAAYEMWQKALVGVDITKKSLDRVEALYNRKVVSAQKRDEVDAQYRAAVATANAAQQQYEMAKEGADNSDKAAARALVERAEGAIAEVESYMGERYMRAPCNGEVVEIYPKRGELIGTGSPIMSIVDMEDVWFRFSVREDKLKDTKVGEIKEVWIPALGEKRYQAKVTYMRAMASYATWRATRNSGDFDMKSFDVKVVPLEPIPDLRPGMTAIIEQK